MPRFDAIVGEYGDVVSIVMPTTADLTASSATIHVRKPDGTTTTWSASIDELNRVVQHTVAAGERDQSGTWQLQGVTVKDDSSAEYLSDPLLYVVGPQL